LAPLELLHRHITSIAPLDAEVWAEMSEYWQPVLYKRKQVLTPIGSVERYIYFVIDGVQRAYIDRGGKDATLVFSYTGSFSGILDSFFLQTPSRYCLETLTQSSFLRIQHNDFLNLMARHRALESWTRIGLTGVLAGTLERNIELLSYSAEERFVTLLKRSPQVLNMIPHKYLASYIGVDPTNFSKLLSRVKV